MGGITVKCTGLDNNVLEMTCQFVCSVISFIFLDSTLVCRFGLPCGWWDSTLIHTYLFGHI